MAIHVQHYLVVSAALFSLGVLGILTRRNAVNVLMGVELVLNAANVNLVAFSRYQTGAGDGHIFAVFVILLAAAEAAIGIAIFMNFYNTLSTIDVDRADELRY